MLLFVVLFGFCWLPLGLKNASKELGGGRRGRKEGEGKEQNKVGTFKTASIFSAKSSGKKFSFTKIPPF
jgi:hypothetical protein